MIAELTVLFQSLVNYAVQCGRQLWIQLGGTYWLAVKDRVENNGRRFARERLLAGSHFVQHCSERKQVGTGINDLATGLFGGHVGYCPDGLARGGEVQILGGF